VQIASTPDFSRTVENVTTDNTSYAPLMTSFGYTRGGTLYWRVAAVDEDRNQGDWTQIQQIRLQPQLRLSVSGLARHKHKGTINVRVVDGTGRLMKGVLVKVTGTGVKTSKRTNAVGRITFKLKPKKRGKLVFSATKAGYQPAYRALKVR
jgi:lipocalin